MMIKLFKTYFGFFFCMFGGGGSSGSSGGNDTLWNAQAAKVNQDSAMSGEMFDYWKKYSPGYLENAHTMTQEAMDGTLTDRMRTKAGADSDQAMAQGLSAATRSTERFGSTLNPNAMSHDVKAVALQGAANKANVMSKATEWGEGQKWARNQDANSMSSGLPGNAVAMSAQAGQGLSSMSSMQSSSNMMDARNASGYGTMGGMMASSMMSKKDGGIIKSVKRGVRFNRGGFVSKAQRFAGGGMPSSPVVGWRDRVAGMPTISRTQNSTDPIGAMLSGAAPMVAMQVAKPYVKDGLSAAWEGIKGLGSPDKSMIPATPGGAPGTEIMPVSGPESITQTSLPDPGVPLEGSEQIASITDGGAGAAETAAEAATTASSEAAATAATDAAATAAAEAGATAAVEAGATAAVEGVAAANAWNPVGWVLGGLALAGAMSRADGGMVEGEGTETSDSIATEVPEGSYILNAGAVKMLDGKALDALNKEGASKQASSGVKMIPVQLSDGEFELNPGAVKMIGKSKLDVINRKGLKFRDDNLAKKGV